MIDNPLAIKRRGMRRHVGPEKGFEQRIKQVLIEMGCEVEKLHGSSFQVGLPDLIVVSPSGEFILIEIKWGKVATVGDVFVKLRARQKSLIPLWGRRGAPVWILCGGLRGHYAVHAGSRDFDSTIQPGHDLRKTLREIITWTRK